MPQWIPDDRAGCPRAGWGTLRPGLRVPQHTRKRMNRWGNAEQGSVPLGGSPGFARMVARLNYIARHWRGELSLAVSFWVNFVALNLLLLAARPVLQQELVALSLDDDPRWMARFALLNVVFVYGIIYPWQLVGVWRAARRYRPPQPRLRWDLASQVAVALSLLITAATLLPSAHTYRDIVSIAFGPDRYGAFSVSRTGDDGSLLHFEGYLGYQAAREVRAAIGEGPPVQAIVLDSPGGWIASGRGLARVIEEADLDTYSFAGCHSACVTAFLAGRNRYLADEARLGFHQYAVPFEGLGAYSSMTVEQYRDLQYYRQQGVRPEFLARLFQAPHEDAWFPTQRELIAARAISGVVRSEEVLFGLPSDVSE